MSIDYRVAEVFQILGCCGNKTSTPKTPFISFSRISSFRDACLQLNIVLIFHLAGKCATQRLKNRRLWSCRHIMDISRSQAKNDDLGLTVSFNIYIYIYIFNYDFRLFYREN